jgi:hypothetical protein
VRKSAPVTPSRQTGQTNLNRRKTIRMKDIERLTLPCGFRWHSGPQYICASGTMQTKV